MSFSYSRTVHFGDTDAAGVVFFPNYLAICHEAYEEGLAGEGIELKALFVANQCLLPIAKCGVQFLGALQSGDRVRIELTPTVTAPEAFTLSYRIFNLTPREKLVALATTEHVCLDIGTLARRPVPPALAKWLGGPSAAGLQSALHMRAKIPSIRPCAF